jgi:1,4-dihydroxy-2-naphthoyl-CoA hydrolase
MSALIAAFNESQRGTLAGLIGLEWLDAHHGFVLGRLRIEGRHLAANGRLHAASVVALADSACGFGCSVSLPASATGFATAELKANLMGTARSGAVTCAAKLLHGGRTTQVWDAEVACDTTGRTIALFRCTQIVLY